MKRLGFTIATLVGMAGLTWSGSCSVNAAGSAKDEISTGEHKCIAATSTTQCMEHSDAQDLVFYDFVPPLQYNGVGVVCSRLDVALQEAKELKGEFVELGVVADHTLGTARNL